MSKTPITLAPPSPRAPKERVSVEDLVNLIYSGDGKQPGIGLSLRDLYTAMDANGDGRLTAADNPEDEEFAILDFDITTFDAALRRSITNMVTHFDADHSGRLSVPELIKVQDHLKGFNLGKIDARDPTSNMITTESLVKALDEAINHGLPSTLKSDGLQR